MYNFQFITHLGKHLIWKRKWKIIVLWLCYYRPFIQLVFSIVFRLWVVVEMLFGVTIYYKPWWMQSPAVHWQNTFCVVFSKFFFYHEWFTIEVWKKFYNLIIGIGFNGGDTIVGKLYPYMLVILLTNSYDLQIFSRTTICHIFHFEC